ncbi:MAG: hypothetical protein FWC03_05250 [Treponema sp.]|nr:hypothetical protein [Treponema sp.]
MEIKINGKPLNFTLDNEKTIGEVLAALEQWLTDSGHRMSELSIDGEIISASMIEDAFSRDIMTLKILDISTKTTAELATSCLLTLLDDIKKYESLDYGEKTQFFKTWQKSAQAKFISEQWSALFSSCADVFSGGSVNSRVLQSITEERLREINKPAQELVNLEPLLIETCNRLVDLPLDIQTGKDKRAAETIQLFSCASEKIFRIYKQLKNQGLLKEESSDASEETKEKSILALINDFGEATKELLQAYERQDIILVGDLAEYEMAPQLQNLYKVIMLNIRGTAGSQ